MRAGGARSGVAGSTWRLVVALALLAGGCRKGAPQGPAGTELEPVPVPPVLQIAPEPVPGAEGGLRVVAARPRGTAGSDVRPAVTFSLPVLALGTVEAQGGPAPASIEPAVPGEWRWLGSASVEFVPKEPLPFSTRFTVTVPAALKSVDGQALGEAYSWNFETPSPVVQRVDPPPGWDWVTPAQHFTVVLNQPVVDLDRALRLVVGAGARAVTWPLTVVKAEPVDDGAEHTGRPRPSVPSRQVRYEVAAGRPLPLDTDVALVLSPSLRGTEGPLTLGTEQRWAFRTYGPLSISAPLGCHPEARRCPYGPLLVFTSNPVVPASLRERLTVEPRVSLDWEQAEVVGGTAQRRPFVAIPGRFRPGTSYRVTIAEGVVDELGQRSGPPDGVRSLSSRGTGRSAWHGNAEQRD